MGDQVGEGRAARGRGEPLDQIAVLGGIGDAIERAKGFASGPTGVGRLGLFERCGVSNHYRVEGGGRTGAVVGVDPGEIGLDKLDRGRPARLERGAQFGNGNLGNLDHAVTAGCWWVRQWMSPSHCTLGSALISLLVSRHATGSGPSAWAGEVPGCSILHQAGSGGISMTIHPPLSLPPALLTS
ncbi:hypothetical protein D3C85_1325270 [compost metagenome]